MAVLRSEHCRNPEPHDAHNGVQRWWDGHRSTVHCDGDPAFLARELEREANPPSGPPDPPRPKIDWTPQNGHSQQEASDG